MARESAAELRLQIEPKRLLDSWVYTIDQGVHVLILAYGCTETTESDAVLSDEHRELAWISIDEIDTLAMPDGYKASIRRWASSATSSPQR